MGWDGMGTHRESCEQLEMELETLEIHLPQTLQQVVNGSHNPYSPLLLSVCNKWSFAANPNHGMRSKLAREEEEENSEMNDTKACLPNPKKRFKLYKNIWITFSRTLRKHIIGGAAGSRPKDILLSHLQNKFVNIITQKMSILQQIRISNKIWQID
jgi:hypothetical protein